MIKLEVVVILFFRAHKVTIIFHIIGINCRKQILKYTHQNVAHKLGGKCQKQDRHNCLRTQNPAVSSSLFYRLMHFSQIPVPDTNAHNNGRIDKHDQDHIDLRGRDPGFQLVRIILHTMKQTNCHNVKRYHR